jgi:hypothetical protein
MATLELEAELEPTATAVRVSQAELTVEFEDGRTLSVPVAWYPRLLDGTAKQRQNFEVGSFGIHWPDLDEDISYRGLLLGRKSGESAGSLKFWMDARRKGKKVTLQDFVNMKRKLKRETKPVGAKKR